MTQQHISTGLVGLDKILDGLRLGDNVVWKVDSIDNYRNFVGPFVAAALADNRKLIYLRFGQHEPLLADDPRITVFNLDATEGFEPFAHRIHTIATEQGREAFYVFDCLSDLLSAWANDHMIANFFQVTCPYLFELDTIAYFALIRDRHALKTISRIRETTQLLLELLSNDGHSYIHPLKVWERHSPTMFLPHLLDGDTFTPLANSYDATNLLTAIHSRSAEISQRQLDHWHRLFLQAQTLCDLNAAPAEQAQMVEHLSRHLLGREQRILALTCAHFGLEDLLNIKSRMIGTGYIGGKAVGMLLARKILETDPDFDWLPYLEGHDSFFVGSNVFYSYIVHNGWWPLFMQQKTAAGYFVAAAELREKMLQGEFPDVIREGFHSLLEYYGQYPIIVRSSSLLEDGFGNAFAGKYESIFCPNQTSPEERYIAFEAAVRQIFASTLSEDALTYRQQRGLDQQDEQMGLLVQRVSGSYRDHYYFPELAGVGVSYNTFVWDKEMDPKAGMMRLVLGLGTRAVDRVEGDYPRIVALDAPAKQPHKGFADTRRFAQREVDLVDVNSNSLRTVPLHLLTDASLRLPLELYGVLDQETMQRLLERGRREKLWILTFDNLLTDGFFTPLMQRLLKRLESTYNYPVDIEFTINFDSKRSPRINVVQCRPLQTKGQQKRVEIPSDLAAERIAFSSEGNFMGGNISQPLAWLIWVDPITYTRLPLQQKFEVARLIGRLNKRIADRKNNPTLLLGPGRWGTSTPSLGVPISFSEISNVAAIGEVAFTSGDLMPELSYGSHFFQDLVEADIFYLALFPDSPECTFNETWMRSLPNALEGLMPASSSYKNVVKVNKVSDLGLILAADIVTQQLICYHK